MFKKKKNDRDYVNNDNGKKIFSYYQNRDQLGSNNGKTNLANKKRGGIFYNVPVFLSIIVIIASIMYTITLSSTPNIIVVNNESLLATDDNIARLSQLSKSKLEQSVFNKSKITINTDKIQNELLEDMPEATDIAVALPIISRSPIIYIRIAEPSVELSSGNKKYILNEKGRVISDNANTSKSLIIVKDKSGLAINLGDQAIPAKQISFINQVKRQFLTKKYEIEYFELSKNANELLVKFREEKFVIKYNLSGDERLQSGTALATLKYLKQKSIKPSQYIDVRVEERAYYK